MLELLEFPDQRPEEFEEHREEELEDNISIPDEIANDSEIDSPDAFFVHSSDEENIERTHR